MSNESNMQRERERERWTQNRAGEAADRSSLEGADMILLHIYRKSEDERSVRARVCVCEKKVCRM